MRVALLSRGAHPLHEPGGLERAVYHLARHLQLCGVETVLLTRPPTRGAGFPGEVVTVPYGRAGSSRHGRVLDRTLHYPLFAKRLGEAVGEMVRARRVDVVHAQGLTALGYGRLRRKDAALQAPLVMNPQGMEEHKAHGLKRLALTPLRALSREAAALSDRVIATDEATRDEVPRHLGVDPARVVVLPNGIDPREIREATPEDSARVVHEALPALAGAFPVFLSVGRLESYKGFGDVLHALSGLAGRSALPARWAWVVVGEGSQRESLAREARAQDLAMRALDSAGQAKRKIRETVSLAQTERQGLTAQLAAGALDRAAPSTPTVGGHVHFAGIVSDAVLHALYEQADVLVHATRYEGSSLVTLEAMAHGLPVVATRAGGIPDKVVDGETGRLVEPGDVEALARALVELVEDAALRAHMGEKGKARALERFSWPQLARRTLALYEELLRERR